MEKKFNHWTERSFESYEFPVNPIAADLDLNNSAYGPNNKPESDFHNINKSSMILNHLALMKDEMLLRTKRMKEVCHDYGLDQPGNDSLHKPNAWEYLINRKYHLVWCNIFKSGSTRYLTSLNIEHNVVVAIYYHDRFTCKASYNERNTNYEISGPIKKQHNLFLFIKDKKLRSISTITKKIEEKCLNTSTR